tara:strand:- start:442 stop:1257 length:816 start_codon:yes stop_codon:yes gene_type:complete
MKPAKFEFQRMNSLEDAIKALGEAEGEMRILGGGQSLGPMMNLRLAQPDFVLDLSSVNGLDNIDEKGGKLKIGARVTHARIEDGEVPGTTGAYMQFVASGISYRSVRNRGTVGGSVAHSDPSADWPSALLALGGEVLAAGPSGSRTISLDGFTIGPFTTGLSWDEVLIGFELPILRPEEMWGYYKVNRKPGEFADAIGAVTIGEEPRAVCGATESVPFRVMEIEQKLAEGINEISVNDVRKILEKYDTGFDDYELQIHAVALSRAVQRAFV